MKPLLVIGLGNPLMGDDGVGCHVASRLAADPRLPDRVEVICGGTDVLRHAGQMEGRERVILIDAMQTGSDPGSVFAFNGDFAELDSRQEHAHHLSVVEAIRLLKMTLPASFTLLGVSIAAAGPGSELSPAVAARLPAILDRVIREL